MKNEVLTLVREIQILREENIELKKTISISKENRDLKNLFKQSIGFIGYLSNSHSPFIFDKANYVINKYNEIMIKYDRKEYVRPRLRTAVTEKQIE